MNILSDGVSVSFFMALVDFFPVALFMVGMGFILKLAHNRIFNLGFAFLAGGVFTGFLAGFAKCTWKMLYAFGLNFVPLNSAFVIYQAVGFMFIAIGAIELAIRMKEEAHLKRGEVLKAKSEVKLNCSIIAAAPILLLFVQEIRVIETPSFFWFLIMALFTIIYLVCFAVICIRAKKPW